MYMLEGKNINNRYVQMELSIASNTPLLLLVLILISSQFTRQSHRTEHTLRRLDRDITLPSLRSSAAFLALPLLLVIVM